MVKLCVYTGYVEPEISTCVFCQVTTDEKDIKVRGKSICKYCAWIWAKLLEDGK